MSVRLKKALAAVLASTRTSRFRRIVRPRSRRKLLILGYHRVMPFDETHQGDLELISATPEEFAWQMRYLRKHFEPVTFAEIADALEGHKALPPRAVSVTFDDGFSDLHEYAWPILRQSAMPATVFVSTDYVDRPQPFWFDLVAWVIMQAPVGSISFRPDLGPFPSGGTATERRASAVRALKWLKNCDEPVRAAAVDALCAQFPALVQEGRGILGRALTWDEMRAMASGGVEFGSHTASHCCLAKVSPEQLDQELVHSKKRLEQELGQQVIALAYPFGGRGAFNDEVIATAQRAGYRIATSYIPGVNDVRSAPRFALVRQHVERTTSRSYFEALVNVPELFD